MVDKTSFEHLCSGKSGFCCDESSWVRLTKEETYNELTFKLITKCETSLIFLKSPSTNVSQFTLDVVPDCRELSVAKAWQTCEKNGYDGLTVLAVLDKSNVPALSSTSYNFAQFVNSLIHSMESHFMFQRINASFALNAMNLWKNEDAADLNMKSCAIVMAWKFEPNSKQDTALRSPLSHLNSTVNVRDEECASPIASKTKRITALPDKLSSQAKDKRRRTIQTTHISTETTTVRKRRGSEVHLPHVRPVQDDDDMEEEDPDISFKKIPETIMPNVRYMKEQQPTLTKAEEPMEVSPSVDDITLGFEKSPVKKAGRKSTGRKSLVPEWPEEEKEQILEFFDNLNPSKSEQTRVALTCKYTQMQLNRELSSKILYQWIQKKGREVKSTTTSFEIPEDNQHEAMLSLFKELDTSNSESSRVAFICKYMNMQYDITINSKEFYNLLNGKGKKTGKRQVK